MALDEPSAITGLWLAEIERVLNRYRYAVIWASADSWEMSGEARSRFEWARANDPGGLLSNDKVATIGAEYLQTTGRIMP
jgi:hypothetical protein